jgi:excinuclease ABC subunit C
MTMSDTVRTKIRTAPDSPGVYRYVDANNDTIYVGKAKHLSRRLASYTRDDLAGRTRRMVGLAVGVEWVVCASEAEALVLEHQLIRHHRPRFNVLMVEGGDYLSVYLTGDAVPRLRIGRGPAWRGEERFGPYPGVRGRELGDALTRVVPVRSCNDTTYQRAVRSGRACLLAEMGRCAAPCVGTVSHEEHAVLVDTLRRGLRSGGQSLLDLTEARMQAAADAQRFEEAAKLRDNMTALRGVLQHRNLPLPAGTNAHAVAVRTRDDGRGTLVVVTLTDAAVTAVRSFQVATAPALPEDPDTPKERVAHDTSTLFHALSELGPVPLVLIEAPIEGADDLAAALSARHGTPVKIAVARSGWRLAPVAIAARNAEESLVRLGMRRPDTAEQRDEAQSVLGELAGYDGPVSRVECLDISHTQGELPVGSFSVALNAEVVESEGRVVHLPAEIGGDDYESMRQSLRRRFTGRQLGMTALPQVLVIDGGRGQVAAAAEVLDELFAGVVAGRPQIVGIAKRHEELWLPLMDTPVMLPRTHPAQMLVQAVRDQAHRQGVSHHRRRRERRALEHGLEDVPGVGDVVARRLLERFGTVQAVAGAAVTDLATVSGVGPKLAQRIWQHFHP